jgi:hypothetical protein
MLIAQQLGKMAYARQHYQARLGTHSMEDSVVTTKMSIHEQKNEILSARVMSDSH